MPSPQKLAGNGNNGSFTPFELFAGEKKIVTDRALAAAGVAFAQFQVVAKNSAGALVLHDPAGSAPVNKAIGITCNAITAGDTNRSVAYYRAGFFNHAALVWNAATDTFVERQQAFDGTEIAIGTLA